VRPPTIVFSSINGYKFRIRYRQVPYVDRFFFVDIKYPDASHLKGWKKEYMKIHKLPEDMPIRYYFGFITLSSQVIRLKSFMDKVAAYDNYLDKF